MLAETGQKESASELSAQDSRGWRAGMILILKAENSSCDCCQLMVSSQAIF